MLVALLPNQISEYWELFRDHINDSLPPVADWGQYDMNELFKALLVGWLQLWLVVDREQTTVGFIITTVYRDPSGVNTLLIYSSVILMKADSKYWIEGLDTLKKYAWSKGCSKIGAFVMNEKLLEILKEHDVETRFVFAHITI